MTVWRNKETRKEKLMGDMYVAAKGAKVTKKAVLEGFNDEVSKYWIGMLMSIPGVSENKAIAIAKSYPTLKSLMNEYTNDEVSQATKKKLLSDIEIEGNFGEDKSKKIGKKIAERVYTTLCSVDPDIPVDEKPE